MKIGIKKELVINVLESLTAKNIGSGDLDVFATPAMIMLMEKASLELIKPYLSDGESTVGTKVDVSHLQATLVGENINIISELVLIDRRRLVFSVKALCNGTLIGEGTHERFIINCEKFMSKLRG